MPTSPINSSTISIIPSLILLLIFLATCLSSSSSIEAAGKYPPSIPSHRTLLAAAQRTTRAGQIPSCSEMVSRSQCSQNPNCRWCKSEALDDMCFGKTEAWRLPQQVFVCG